MSTGTVLLLVLAAFIATFAGRVGFLLVAVVLVIVFQDPIRNTLQDYATYLR